jgi:two-component system, chemotaxis family, chemotaxis protein CheY
MKILIADDSKLFRNELKNFLIDQGFDVIEAVDGKEAINLYAKHKPDLVLMDIVMPECDGIRAMQEIKTKDPLAKVIILSSMGQQSKIIEAIQKGAIDFIVKPFEPNKVLTAIENTT